MMSWFKKKSEGNTSKSAYKHYSSTYEPYLIEEGICKLYMRGVVCYGMYTNIMFRNYIITYFDKMNIKHSMKLIPTSEVGCRDIGDSGGSLDNPKVILELLDSLETFYEYYYVKGIRPEEEV